MRCTLLVNLLALVIGGTALASVVHQASLEQVVDRTDVVFVAQVVTFQATRTPDGRWMRYDVALADAPEVHAQLLYTEYDPRPNPAGGFEDPLWTGSGLEDQVQVGDSYVFLVHSAQRPGDALDLLRIEPLDRERLVMSAWRMSLFRRMATPIELPVQGD